MTISTRMTALFLSTSLLALSACQPSVEAPGQAKTAVETIQAVAFDATNIPHAQLPVAVVPKSYVIDMNIDPAAVGMTGTVVIEAELLRADNGFWLHAKEMTVPKVTLSQKGETLMGTFSAVSLEDAPSGLAYVTFDETFDAGPATITMEYSTPYNQSLNSAYQVKRGDEAYIVTQMEPLGAREAFPSFDEPKYKVPFTLSITAPADMEVWSNTPEVALTTAKSGWMKHQFAQTRPLPTYLIAFGVGPYDVVDYADIPPNSVRSRPLELRGFSAKGSGASLDYALKNTDGILTAMEEYFGTEYPYEKLDLIAAPDYAFGAMENPGAIVYREYLLLLSDDAPLSQQRSYARVHSHELAHQWFGNLVTPVWWEDIWLNEAFATWMGNKALTLWKPEGDFGRTTLNASLGAMNIDTLSTTRRVREPLDRSENVMDQFDGITYRKGGGVLDMFESYVGEDNFQAGVRLHMDRYADGVATGDDFFASIAEGSGRPEVVAAMKSFVDQPGLPLVTGKLECSNNQSRVTLSQSRYAPLGSKTQQGQSWQIPVCVKFGFDTGDVRKECTLMTETEMTFAPEKLDCADWMTLNENGAGYYRFTLDTDGWADLIKSLPQLNSREALSTLDSLIASFRAGEVESAVFIAGMEAFAKHPEYDVASKAGDLLGFMYSEMPDSRANLSRLVRDMYADRYRANLGKDTVEANLLQPTLARALITRGGDTDIQAEFAEAGAKYLGLSGQANKSAVAQNMLSTALRETVKRDGAKAVPVLREMVKNGSSFEKGAAVGALGQVQSAELGQALRAAALTDTTGMTGRQALSLVSVMMDNEAQADATWAWLQDNFETFVTTRVPDVRKGGLPGVASGFCSTDERDAVEAFFKANADVVPGYERSLMQTLESIELCAALKSEKREELAAALNTR